MIKLPKPLATEGVWYPNGTDKPGVVGDCYTAEQMLQFRRDALEEAQVWLPIDSAPKDGTEVLVITKELGALVMFWDMYHPNAMWSTGLGVARLKPTHWMPLPAPPKETT
jgi:hypothetical protein